MISVQKNDIFYCYAQEDKLLRDEQEKHLSELKRKFQLTTSRDRIIRPGEAWSEIIDLHLYTAYLIFWLISPDFMESGYYSGKEIRRALLRHRPNNCLPLFPIFFAKVSRSAAYNSYLPTLSQSLYGKILKTLFRK